MDPLARLLAAPRPAPPRLDALDALGVRRLANEVAALLPRLPRHLQPDAAYLAGSRLAAVDKQLYRAPGFALLPLAHAPLAQPPPPPAEGALLAALSLGLGRGSLPEARRPADCSAPCAR